jgi:glycosyltransferase involved in cell wall biosynthesis
MSVGIYTHYAHCDQAYFAVRLADFLRDHGVDCSIYADNPPAKLRTGYDNSVMHKRRLPFTEWAEFAQTIVWTHVPRIEQITYAKRMGIRTVLVPMWQELQPPFKKAIRQADHLIALSTECRELYHAVYKFRNVTMIPFDAGLPVVKKDSNIDPKSVKLLLPWFDRNARCTQSDFLSHLAYLLPNMPEARLTVGISSSKFSPAIAQFFRRLSHKTQGRVVLRRNVPVTARPGLFAEHDLTIFPAECDNYGFCNLVSINSGTPVLTFAVPPQTDFVYPDANGVLVRTKVDYDENGVPHAAPRYELFAAALQTMIAEPEHINALNKKINYNLHSRRKSFDLGWQSILRLT